MKYYINKTGLVPCAILTNFGIYEEGKIAGFAPKIVKSLENDELVQPLTEEDLQEFTEKTPAATEEVPAVTFSVDGRKVEIPMNYEEIHHHKLKKIAQAIDPTIDEIKKVESLEIIEKFMAEQVNKANGGADTSEDEGNASGDDTQTEGAE